MTQSSDPPPADAFLAAYPEPIVELADALRRVVRIAVPNAIERVRLGWRLIGYDAPHGRRTVYFCYVAPEPEHVHLGFEQGAAMRDPHGRLEGAGVTRQVRWVTFRPRDAVDEDVLVPLVQEALRVARLTRAERFTDVIAREETGREA